MAVNKKFLEAVSKDEALKAELEQAALEALKEFLKAKGLDEEAGKLEIEQTKFEAVDEFLKAKGLEEEAGKIMEEIMHQAAEAHGCKPEKKEKLSDDELDAVVGGFNEKYCFCIVGGGGG